MTNSHAKQQPTDEQVPALEKHRDLTTNESVEEMREYDARTCEVCGDPVAGGLEGMAEHLDEHDAEEVAAALSFEWNPDEPLAVHLPNGTTHFVSAGDLKHRVDVYCGQHITADSVGADIDSISELISYDYADADDYCGNCAKLYERKYGQRALPEPLLESSEGDA